MRVESRKTAALKVESKLKIDSLKRLSLILSCLMCFACYGGAQKADKNPILKQLGSAPALCDVAPLPKEQAKKMEKLEKEKKEKLVRQGMYLPKVDTRVLTNVEKYVTSGDKECAIVANGPYTISIPTLKITNSSHGIGDINFDNQTFNIKKDRLSNAVLSSKNEIRILNRKNKTCHMSDFIFTTESDAIKMEGNKVVFQVPTLNIAAGDYPSKYKVTCTHIPSDAKYTFDLECVWRDHMYCTKENGVYTFDWLGSDTFPDLALMCNMKTKVMEVVRLPFTFDGEGANGSNGRRGSNGTNGIDERSWQDKDGKTHYIKGTCARPGEDGGNGEDGEPGSLFLICISDLLIQQFGLESVTALVDGGKGGKGGAGGKGGIHGRGSSCYKEMPDGTKARAADGRPGKDGRDGARGDFLYVVADVVGFYLKAIGQ